MVSCQKNIPINDNSQIGEARRQVSQLAVDLRFAECDQGKAAIIVSELATNLARYAPGGEILLHSVTTTQGKFIDILAVDRGPGLADVDRCLEDGYSTGGTPGNGLGAARRLASEFDIYSSTPGGTIVFCRLAEAALPSRPPDRFSWGVVSKPALHEIECGDAWSLCERPDGLALVIVDGLGHGPEAAKAARAATDVFDHDPFTPLSRFFESAHARMQGTRGGAMAAAHIDANSGALSYVGIGNIAGHLRGTDGRPGRGLFSHSGIVGVQVRKVQQFDYECPVGGLLIMHSDGLQGRWILDKYAGLAGRHPAVIAGILYRDFIRGHDDVTVAVVRRAAGKQATGGG